MEKIIQSSLLNKIPGIQHGFTTKLLPLSEQVEIENKTSTVKQVHKDLLVWIDHFEKRKQEADALATQTPLLPLGVFSADCTPVLLVAIEDGKPIAIAAIHAGWRGTALKIVEKSFATFAEITKAKKFMAAIGPCISKASFEVGQEVIDAFPQAENLGLAHFLRLEDGKRKYLMDLSGENFRQLQNAAAQAKVSLEIDNLGHCTFKESHRYHSFRRDREKAGRILSFLSFDR